MEEYPSYLTMNLVRYTFFLKNDDTIITNHYCLINVGPYLCYFLYSLFLLLMSVAQLVEVGYLNTS